MNEQQYNKVYEWAGKADDLAAKIEEGYDALEGLVGKVLNYTEQVSEVIVSGLVEGAEEARRRADAEAVKNPWAGSTDNPSDTIKFPDDVVKAVTEGFSQIFKSKKNPWGPV